MADGWKAGVAKVVITPEHFMWMSGYGGRDRPAEGTLTDLFAKALVVEDSDGRRGVLVTLDIVGIDRALSLQMREALRLEYGFKLPQIALCVSHTHTGPVIGTNLRLAYALDEEQERVIDEYAVTLMQKVVEVVGAALADVEPSELSWGIGRSTFAVNRRENKPYSIVPERRAAGTLKGPVDHEVPVLKVSTDAGRLKTVVVGYACHCTVLRFYQWSGDYAGYAQLELEKAYPGSVAMFWAGCGGDQNPLPRRTVSLAVEYGRQLAQAAKDVLVGNLYPISGSMGMVYEEVHLPVDELPTRAELETRAQNLEGYHREYARHLLKTIQRDGRLKQTYPYPLQTWRLGPDLLFVTMGGEVVVDYSLRIKREIGPGATWVAAYANDVMGYIPSRRVLAEGGYEGGESNVYYGLPALWAPAIEELIVDTVHRQVEQLRGGGESRDR